jgi:hypothetical protein
MLYRETILFNQRREVQNIRQYDRSNQSNQPYYYEVIDVALALDFYANKQN